MRKLLSVLIITALFAGCKTSTSPGDSGTHFTAHQGVSGYVYDQATGGGMSGATVALKAVPERRTTTSGSGHYLFDTVPTGSYNIQAWATGTYLQGMLVIVDSNTYKSVDFQLGSTSITTGLLALLRFSGNAVDSSPFGRQATITGGTYVADRFGKPASALLLNGTSNFISVPDAADLNFGKYDGFTICFWAKDPVFTHTSAVVRKGSGSPFVGYEIACSNYGLSSDVGTTYGTAQSQTESPYSSDSRWHFFIFKYDRYGGKIAFYFDGSQYDDGSYTRNTPATAMEGNIDNTSPLLVGSDGSGHFFKGTIDDVRIYKGLLNDMQINSVYHEYGW